MNIDERYKRRTIRLSPFVDNELEVIARKNNISVNKLVAELILYHINELDRVNNVSNVSVILEKLNNIQIDINELNKKYNWLNSLIKQIFANSGFAKNRDINEDSVYLEFVNNRYKKKYDKDFNS